MEEKIKKLIDQKFTLFKIDATQEISKNFPYLEKFLYIKKIWVLIPIAILYLLNITFIVLLVNFIIYLPILIIRMIYFDLKFQILVIPEFIKEYLLNWFPLLLEILFYFIGLGLYEIFGIFLNFIDYFRILLENFKWNFAEEIHKHYFLGGPDGVLNEAYKIKYVGDTNISRWNDIYVKFFDVFSTHFFYSILKIKNIISVLFVWVFYVFIFLYIFLEALFYTIDIFFGIYIPTLFMKGLWFILIYLYNFFEYISSDGLDLVLNKITQVFNVFDYFISVIKKFFVDAWKELKSVRSFTDIINIAKQIFEIEWKKHFLTIKNYTFEDFKKFWRSKG